MVAQHKRIRALSPNIVVITRSHFCHSVVIPALRLGIPHRINMRIGHKWLLVFATLAVLPARGQSPIMSSVLEPHKDSLYITVFADGNLRTIATQNAEQEATAALGISILRGDSSQWAAEISVASTIDTLRANFAKAILIPGASGGAFQSGVLDVRIFRFFDFVGGIVEETTWGLHAYAAASNSAWETSEEAISVSTVAAGLMAFTELVKRQLGGNGVSLSVEGGLSVRYLGGDVGSFREDVEALIGSRGRSYVGLEGGMQIQFNQISASLQFYKLWDLEEGQTVRGLTGLQVVAGIGVQVNIFNESTSLARGS